MSNIKTQNSWSIIQEGIKEVERLLSQKEYNLCMVKSRQVLEYMVNSLTGTNSDEIELIDKIDNLYKNKIISKSSLENYHKIRMIGNKAIHQNDNNAYSANNVYSLLSQEIVVFSQAKSSVLNLKRKSNKTKEPKVLKRRLIRRNRNNQFDLSHLAKILIPILLIILVALIFSYCSKKSANKKETLPSIQSTEQTQESTAVVEETKETTEVLEQANIYITTANLNVRVAPNMEANIITTLPKSSEVEFVSAHDAEWSIINYNGAQAYVSSKYIKIKEN